MNDADAPSLPVWRPQDGPGAVLQLIASGRAVTRGAIAEALGLSRSTVLDRLGLLIGAGLVGGTEEVVSGRGRPSQVLRLDTKERLIIAVDIGEERTRVAVTDLGAEIRGERVERLELSDGPEALLSRVSAIAREVLADEGLSADKVVGLGLGLPAPVDYEAGQVQGWSIMSGWDGFDIRSALGRDWPVPVVIDNDVNLLTLAEQRTHWPDERHLLYIKAGTGVGSGMVVGGAIHRGAQGAAGDIGHAHISGYHDPLCRCGNRGCLEALVGGWALAEALRADRPGLRSARDVAGLVKRGDSDAVALLRTAGRILGEAAAFATSMLNPSVIVLGGALSAAGDHLIAGVREVIYQRALPLATRQLRIVPTHFRSRAGIAGASLLVRDHVLDPAAIDARLAGAPRP